MKRIQLSLVQLFITFLVFGQPLEITVEDYTAIPAEQFCLELKADGFNQLVSSQYSILWDETVLSFDTLVNIGLPLPDNLFFNTAFIDNGILLINWFDPLGGGHDLADGSVMYELCFEAIGSIGSNTTLEFSDLPLEIEVISIPGGEQDIGVDFSGGYVEIVAPLGLSSFNLDQPNCLNPEEGSIEIVPVGDSPPYSFLWSGPDNFSSTNQNIANLNSGTYYLTLTGSSIPPVSYLDTFEIDAAINLPVVIIEQEATLTCADSIITLDATGSSEGIDYDIIWSTSNGNILLNASTLNPTVDAIGEYQLVITNENNGCSTTASVTVDEDLTMPTALGGDDGLINCDNIVAILDGSISSAGPDISAFWTSQDGNILTGENTFIATVNASGTYEITVIDQGNGCFDTDEVWVGVDTISPQADAGMDQVQNCFDHIINLDGTESSSGGGFQYEWTTTAGTILNGVNNLMPQVNSPGTYQLLVTNTVNGCTNSDNTLITLNEDLVAAEAGMDQTLCEDFFQLSSNLPANNSGLWSFSGVANIDDTTADDALLTGLSGGINEFVWTLSTADCPNYDSDTIVLTLENIPVTQEDQITIPHGENPVLLDVISNDGVLTVSDFNLEVISNPALGNLIQIPDNQLNFSYPEAYFGMLEFEYSLCNNFCPDLCDTSVVSLNILDQLRIDTTVEIPSGITPNGDGLNDQFVIPILENNPGDFAENELIIFNRWGNVVFQSKPYFNNWSGKNDNGNELPQGTYYFILRLDLGQGEIIKGEVTILR